MKALRVRSLGPTPYAEGLALQQHIQSAQREGVEGDCLLLLEHPPVVTLGRSAHVEHLLATREALVAQGIECWEADRGGDVTYHGPGQLVGYPLLKLEGAWQDVKKYIHALEEVLIQALRPWGVEGRREARWPGVWVESRHGGLRKLAAIGVHMSRWHTRHGFALNLAPRLEHFGLIVPCGIREAGVTSVEAELWAAPTRAQVEPLLVAAFCEVFGYILSP
ncbi:MAG: lipoyl(octanoyl) transferase LipB [Proteobacteria bacterium]|nr:lipoyl(octanoyl) transferase LipB [Cystobacterineae bacterium]MCL2313646.1 lipoyl(octanoyl) transferase LipB [Pseudomonadota bacterium]